ncbi:hypothetical protein MKEN_00222900 [Mycena kentingensis (nom. inval.)]|nr:hypothetical protein MKEN_00222900 [Mycena kentingensis (nom. inval.)]
MADIDYTQVFGLHSIPAAVIFTVLYIPLLLWFVVQSVRNTTYVYIVLTVFCLMRIGAFVLRAILIGINSLHNSLNTFIVDQVLFGVGFFALLYSAYTLVLDREIVMNGDAMSKPSSYAEATSRQPLIIRLTRNRHLFRIALMVAVALGVSGITSSTSSNPDKVETGSHLRKASTILFIVLTAIQALQTALAFRDSRAQGYHHRHGASAAGAFGNRHGTYLLVLISLLLIIREVFLVAVINDASRQNNEAFWYPFVALTELLAVCCYAVPGLVPPRAEVKRRTRDVETLGMR